MIIRIHRFDREGHERQKRTVVGFVSGGQELLLKCLRMAKNWARHRKRYYNQRIITQTVQFDLEVCEIEDMSVDHEKQEKIDPSTDSGRVFGGEGRRMPPDTPKIGYSFVEY